MHLCVLEMKNHNTYNVFLYTVCVQEVSANLSSQHSLCFEITMKSYGMYKCIEKNIYESTYILITSRGNMCIIHQMNIF